MKITHLLKKYFIPGNHNDHKPHILRTEMTVVFLGFILLAEVIFLAQIFIFYPRGGYFAEVMPIVVASLANEDRQLEQLPELRENALLEKAAQLKANDMAEKGYFAHVSPEAVTPWHWFDKAGYVYDYAGENLAVNFYDSNDLNRAWMQSESHRKNILNGNFTEIGIATAKGIYKGKETIFVVQMFGRPAQKEVAPKPGVASIAKQSPVKNGVSTGTEQMRIQEGGEVSGASDSALARIESVTVQPKASLFERMMAMPRVANMYFYGVLLTIIALALALKIFIKIRIQHSQLIVNGAMLLILMEVALLVNQKIVLYYANIAAY